LQCQYIDAPVRRGEVTKLPPLVALVSGDSDPETLTTKTSMRATRS